MADLDLVDGPHAINQPPGARSPGGALSPPMLLGDTMKFILFHDAHTLWAYETSGGLAWSITSPRRTIGGFAVDGDNLYLQDGDALCQYDMAALKTGAVRPPVNAIFFRTAVPTLWSGGGASYETQQDTLVADPRGPAAPVYSAPVILPRGENARLHVLRSDGHVFSPPMNLQPPQQLAPGESFWISKTTRTTDRPVLYVDGLNVCWISGGNVWILDGNQLDLKGVAIESWQWNCIRTSTDQPAMAFGGAAATRGFISSVSTDSADGGRTAAVLVRDEQSARWSLHLVTPPCGPLFDAGGSVMEAASGAAFGHRDSGLPTGLVFNMPPSSGVRECCGVVQGRSGAALDILAAPYVAKEASGRFVYVIATAGSSPALYKYRAPADDGNFVNAWWWTVKAASTTVQRFLARRIVYALTEETQKAIDQADLAQGRPQTCPASPLLSAGRIIPWDKFGTVAPANMQFAILATFAKPVDPNSVQSGSSDSRPSAPLFGPVLFSFGDAEYLVASNRDAICGFRSDGTLAWRLLARCGFYGWVQAGKFLFVSEGGFLSRYDVTKLGTGTSAVYPDLAIDISLGGYVVQMRGFGDTVTHYWGGRSWSIWQVQDNAENSSRFDLQVGSWVQYRRHDSAGDFAPHIDANARTIRLRLHHDLGFVRHRPHGADSPFPAPEREVIAFPIDSQGAFVLGSISAGSDLVNDLRRDHDTTTDAPKAAWQPPAVPDILMGGVNAYIDQVPPLTASSSSRFGSFSYSVRWPGTELKQAAANLQLNLSDGIPAEICGTPQVRKDADGRVYAYCCMAKRQQNFFVKFPLVF